MDTNAILKWANCCRLCLLDDGIKLPIFEGEGVQRQVARKIQTCFPILIYMGDPLPKMICHKCLYKLDTVYDFRHKCLEANAVLKNKLSALKHIPEVTHYLSKLGKQEAKLEGLSSAQTMGQDPMIRRKNGGTNSTNTQTKKSVAGNMFQGIFIADCSSEVFLPEHGGDSRQRSVPANSSRNSGSEVTSSQPVRTPVSSMLPVLNVPVPNQNSRGNSEKKTIQIVDSSDIGAVTIKQEPPDEDNVSTIPSSQTKVIQHNVLPAMTTPMRTSWSTLSPSSSTSSSSSNVPYPVTSLSIKSLMSLQPPAPLQSQIPIQSLTPQMPQPPLKYQRTNSVTQSSIVPTHSSVIPPKSSFTAPQPSTIPSKPPAVLPKSMTVPPRLTAIPPKHLALSPQLSSIPSRFSVVPKPTNMLSQSSVIPPQLSTLPPRLSAIPSQHSTIQPQSTLLPRLLNMQPKPTSMPSSLPSTLPPQFSTLPPQFSTLPPQSSTLPPYSSTLQLHSSLLPPHSSTLPPQSSTLQLHSSLLPPHSSTLPQQSSTLPPYSSTLPPYSSTLPPHSSTLPPHSSTLPSHSSTLPPHSSTLPPHSSTLPPHSSTLPPQSSTLPPYSSTLQLHSSLLPPHSSPLPQQSSTLPPYSSTLPPHSSTLPPHSTLLPHSSISNLPPHSSTSNSPPQTSTLPLQSSTSILPPQSSSISQVSALPPQPSNILRETLSSPTKSRFFKQHGISPWNCEYCNKYYKSRDTLHKHRKYFCPNKSTCNKCGGVFSNAVELAIHQKSHLRVNVSLPEERLLACTMCNKKFAARSMLHMHKKVHEKMEQQNTTLQSEKQFQCPHCPRTYVKKFNLQVHLRVHMRSQDNALGTGKSETEQIVPENSGGDEWSIVKKEDEVVEESIPQWKQKCSCKYCGHICVDSTALWMHMVQQHSSDQAFRCDKCGKEFNQQQAYLAHKKTMCVKVRCKMCGKLYASPKALREHEWNKHGVERATHHCRLCGQSFVTRSALLIHGRVHHVVKKGSDSPLPIKQQVENIEEPDVVSSQEENLNLPCKICLRVFTNHQALQRHIKIHATGKHVFYPCEICGKKFVSLEMYKTHAASHTVSQSFHCSRCNKIFFKEEVFRSHTCESSSKQACMTCGMMLTENHVCREKVDDEVVPCKQCSAVFSSLKALSCHMRMHKRQNELLATDFKRSCIRMTNGLYKCNICGKLTTTQQGAAAHSRWHVGPTPNRPFKCPFCKRKYSSESGLYSHISVEHPESA